MRPSEPADGDPGSASEANGAGQAERAVAEINVECRPWKQVFRGIEHRAFVASVSPKTVTIKAPLWLCQWLLETTHDDSGLWVRHAEEGATGLVVRMSSGDFALQPIPDAPDEFAGEWVEVYRNGFLIERLQTRCEIPRPAPGPVSVPGG